MTLEEASQEASRINGIMGTATAKSMTIYYWLPTFVKDYDVVLIPTKYETEYNAATDSQKIAFKRVSRLAQQGNISLTDFVTNFDTEGGNDSELSSYLSL